MADDSDTHRFFDFFGLPRELRDEIYCQLGQQVDLASDDTEEPTVIQATIRNVPIPKLLCLCTQFKEEYEKNLSGAQTLVLQDNGANTDLWVNDSLPSFSKVEMQIMVVCENDCPNTGRCTAADDLGDHREWIQGFLDTSDSLTSLKVEIHVQACNRITRTWPKLGHGVDFSKALTFLTNSSRLQQVTVTLFESTLEAVREDNVKGLEIYRETRDHVATWSREAGWREAAAR